MHREKKDFSGEGTKGREGPRKEERKRGIESEGVREYRRKKKG